MLSAAFRCAGETDGKVKSAIGPDNSGAMADADAFFSCVTCSCAALDKTCDASPSATWDAS